MDDLDPYATIARAAELDGCDERTIHRRIEDGMVVVKPGDEPSRNGRPEKLARLRMMRADLDAQIRQLERKR